MSWKRVDVLRIVVTGALLSAAVIFGSLSYVILSGYEYQAAVQDFHNIAHYALEALQKSLLQKEEIVLAMSKHMAYFHPNETAWPNVVWPGFYDSSDPQRKGAGLDDMFFLPIVHPDRLPSFEDFMYKYFASEPAIGPSGGFPMVHGVWAVGPYGVYHDTSGETLLYSSPNRFLTPMLQSTFNQFTPPQTLGLNMHCFGELGRAIDSLYRCGEKFNYTAAAIGCMNITEIVNFPIGASDEDVKDFHTAILQPIYLNQNTSQVMGFIAGGFNWLNFLSGLTDENTVGVIITVRNNDLTLTFDADRGVARFSDFGDRHQRHRNNDLGHSITIFPGPDGTETSSTYVISMYPRLKYFASYRTANPTYAAIASSILIALCAVTFFFYDYYVRGESEASAAVLETKRLFVRFISHEVRTPLNAVHLGLEALTAELRKCLEMLRASPLNSYEIASNLLSVLDVNLLSWLELSSEMMTNSSAAEDVLDDLLNYDKIEMGTLRLEFSVVPIWDVVRNNTNVFHNNVKVKNIRLSLENHLSAFAVEGRGPSSDVDVEHHDFSQFVVIGDPTRLAQVMRNLISNALKFTPVDGTISVQAERLSGGLLNPTLLLPAESMHLLELPRAGSIRISVTDSGVGLTVDQLAQICSEGVQFNANELQAGKGSGLGLFISKGIVEQHGGQLTVTSAGIDHGTTFTVELPLYHRQSADAVTSTSLSYSRTADIKVTPITTLPANDFAIQATTAESLSATETAPGLAPEEKGKVSQPKRILVVDDVLSNRKMLIRVLSSKGYVCEQAEDGQQAIDVYRASLASGNPFDAITMDFEMPVMNGPTATGHLRAMGCTVPIIGVTGNMLPEDIKYFMTQGATEVMGKPLNIFRFQELV